MVLVDLLCNTTLGDPFDLGGDAEIVGSHTRTGCQDKHTTKESPATIDILEEISRDFDRIVEDNLKKTSKRIISEPGFQQQSANLKRTIEREIISGVLSRYH